MIIAEHQQYHQYHHQYQCHQYYTVLLYYIIIILILPIKIFACCLHNKCLFISSFYKIYNVFLNRQTIIFLTDN